MGISKGLTQKVSKCLWLCSRAVLLMPALSFLARDKQHSTPSRVVRAEHNGGWPSFKAIYLGQRWGEGRLMVMSWLLWLVTVRLEPEEEGKPRRQNPAKEWRAKFLGENAAGSHPARGRRQLSFRPPSCFQPLISKYPWCSRQTVLWGQKSTRGQRGWPRGGYMDPGTDIIT